MPKLKNSYASLARPLAVNKDSMGVNPAQQQIGSPVSQGSATAAPDPLKPMSKDPNTFSAENKLGASVQSGMPEAPKLSMTSKAPDSFGDMKIGEKLQPVRTPGMMDRAPNAPTSGFNTTPGVGNFAKPPEKKPEMGEPKIYDSVGSAGSGFINLSHLLGLNKQSGQNSANDLAARTSKAGYDAQVGISKLGKEFQDQADAQTKQWGVYGGDEKALTKKSGLGDGLGAEGKFAAGLGKDAKYTGPNDLTGLSGYAGLAKKVGEAQDMATNVSGGATGLAAQVNKETGLSPTQSAASAFYMGVNNPKLRAAKNFTNLQSSLAEANSRAMGVSSLARQTATQGRNNYDQFNQKLDAKNAALANAPTPKKKGDGKVNGQNLKEFLGTTDMGTVHQAGMALSPVDWAARGLGEAGVYSGQLPSEMYSGGFTGGAQGNNWNTGDLRSAMQDIQNEYGGEAAEAYWQAASENPGMLDAFAGMNPGAIRRQIRQWMESAGYSKRDKSKDHTQIRSEGNGGNAEAGTSDDQEAARIQAYKDGWGSSWDEQWRNGNKNPEKT